MWWILLIIIMLIGILFYAHRNTYRPTLNHIELPVRNYPALSDLNILHLSDIHMENLSITADHLLQLVQGQKIDMIVLTGDYLDRIRSYQKVLNYIQALVDLKPTYGIYLVFGNHDYVLKDKLNPLKQELIQMGVHVLQNENRILTINGEKLAIIGIDDYSTRRSNINLSYVGVPEDAFKLILTHDPNVVLKMNGTPFDYLLSGHFHGGQIHWPRPYHLAKMGKLARMNIIKGLHFSEGKPYYISEGLGQTGVNIRLRSRPEITFHKLVLANDDMQKITVSSTEKAS
jgi:predicted MPP superfamily phosphohydrolase